ncbi:MAG TPA: hypothetical protein VGZ29_05655 [Terriglobia bacterium]|nr:hypothetical protein [Terriglobia bacterium]
MNGTVIGNTATDDMIIVAYDLPAAPHAQEDSKAMVAIGASGPNGQGYNLVQFFEPCSGVVWAIYRAIAGGN